MWGVIIGIRILGPLELVAADRSWKIGGPRDQVVLAMLALRVHRVVSVGQLIDAVWGDHPPPSARGQVQTSISTLRKLLADAGMPDAIKTRSSGYVLEVIEENLDSARFTALVAAAQQQAAAEQRDVAAETLRGALDLWRGPALHGIRSDLVHNAVAALEEARLTAAEERTRLELELGRHGAIIGELRALVAEHPWRERLYAFLMLALYRTGRQAEALGVYRQAREVLVTDVGIEPGQELRDLERAVLSKDHSLDLRLSEPEAQAVPQAGEPGDEPAAIPRQLPATIADFVGRDDQLADITRFLTGRHHAVRYAVPVVAISGMGGVGKSTLALRVAHELGTTFTDGHMYVDLGEPGGDRSAHTLLGRFLRALGVPASLIPDGLGERVEVYRSKLADKRLLLVLDDAAGEEQVLPLLPGSPSCAVIVTSRSRLTGLPGAQTVRLDPFDDETSAELLARVVGARRLEDERDAAVEVIEYCGGLPLALRIAGARLASYPNWRVGRLARRLADDARRLDELSHGGMAVRTSIGQAYHGLPAVAQRLLRLLATTTVQDFPGWTAAALLDTDRTDAEDAVDRLVEVQLLDVLRDGAGRIRYRLHDLVRVFAQERLADTETGADRRAAVHRVLGAWLALAEMAHRKEYGGDYAIVHGSAPRHVLPEWADEDPVGAPMEWLDDERTALVSVVRQAAAAGLDELCWDLALTAAGLFHLRGYLEDWREAAELAHAAAVRAGNHAGTAAMLYTLGSLHLYRKQFRAAGRRYTEAYTLFESAGNPRGQALVVCGAAFVDRLQGTFGARLAVYETALASMRAAGDLIGQACILTNMARFQLDEDGPGEAGRLLAEALELCRRANNQRGETRVLAGLAELYRRTRQVARARRTLGDVLQTMRQTGDRAGEAHTLYSFGLVRLDEGQLDTAEATLAHALSIAERIGDRLIEGQVHYAFGEIAVVRVDYAAAARHLEQARAVFGELGLGLWLAKTHLLLAEVHAALGAGKSAGADLELARELLSTVDSRQSDRLTRRVELVRAVQLADGIAG